MVKTPPPQQQQQQPAQRHKRKQTVGAITMDEPLVLPIPPVFAALANSDVSDFSVYSDCNSEDLDERTVGPRAGKTNISEHVATISKPGPWDVDSDDLDLQKWQTQKRRVPKPTYSETLKGSAPGSSAKPRELLKFVKKKNLVRR
jgi:hypothetical protein